MLSICCNSRIESWKNPESVTKFKHLIYRYKLEGINFPLEKEDWKQFEKNIGTNTLNFLYAKTEKIYPGYVLKHKPNRYSFNDSKQRRMVLSCNKKLSALLREIMSKHNDDFLLFELPSFFCNRKQVWIY